MARGQKFTLIWAFLLLSGWPAAQEKPRETSLTAQQTAASPPKVVSASVPFYPELARQTRAQGVVTLRLSTDGKRVVIIDSANGPALLVEAAKENVKTWQFDAHAPTSFEVTFRYRLLVPECDSQCRCEAAEKDSVLLQLPTNVELTAKTLLTCDPAVEIRHKKRGASAQPK